MSIKLNSASGSITISPEDGSGDAAVTFPRAGFASLASPTFTGTPAAPTASTGTNTTQIATTAFVQGEVTALVDSAPSTLNTLNELAAALGDDASFSTTVTNSIATKLPLAGGTMTGAIDMGANNITTTGKILFANMYAQLSDLPSATTYHGMFAHVHATGKGYFAHGGNWVPLVSEDTSGDVTLSGALTVNDTLDIEEVYEKVTVQTSTTGTITFDTTVQGVELYTANQTANRTINFSNVNANLAVGQSVTVAIAMTQGSTAYYLNAYQVDGSSVTPKWSGGSAPTAGNASSIDSYTFTIIKTADATFTVLASLTQYA
tara:strand:+ start:422 stop:1378 length:957 start_codon:yes stop_codon:yes gene_type:complete